MVDPLELVKEPDGHRLHEVELTKFEKVPGRHGVHEYEFNELEKVPGGQGRQGCKLLFQ